MAKKHPVRLWSDTLEDRVVPSVVDGVEFRTIDGTDNNPNRENQGAAETQQIRFGYGDDFPDDNGDTIITSPNPRVVSNALLDQDVSIPSANHLTDWAFQWGQWVTHDMDLTRSGPQFNQPSDPTLPSNFNIPITEADDPFGQGNVIPFNRSEFAAGTGANGIRRDVVNSITSYIDASNVYGSDPVRAAALRTFEGGKLRTSPGADGIIGTQDDLLPFWDPNSGIPNATPPQPIAHPLFLAGDFRANEQVNLTAVHTLFVREHNRLADIIHTLYPDLNDEQIFQFARRLVGAEQQIITYEEYLPATLGYDLAPNPDNYLYQPGTVDALGRLVGNVEADVTNSFAHAAFRFGHSQINEATLLVNAINQIVGSLSIDDAFFNPSFLTSAANNLARTLKGLAFQTGQEVDLGLVDGIRNNLFGNVGGGGIDLGSLDIQRGRDHGLPDFNNLVGAYRSLGLDAAGAAVRYTSFADFAARNPIAAANGVVTTLEQLYGSIDLIDPFVGMLAEDHLPGSNVGPLLNSIIGNQFLRLRDGDRFFYTGDAFLQLPEVKAVLDINDVTLANVIRWNTGAVGLQDNVFFDRSVLIVEAPDAGSNLSVVAALGVVTVINNQTGSVLAVRSASTVERVILVGSDTSADVFNLFLGAANGGIEDGVVAYGRGGTADRLNVFGNPFVSDTFTVADSSFTTGSVTGLRRGSGNPAENAVIQSVSGRNVGVNGNNVFSSGFETTRLVTLFGNDTITDPLGLALVSSLWNPLSND